jgi:predicted amidohydrolase
MTSVTVALIQTCASIDIEANLRLVETQIREAVRQGAELIVLPENVSTIAQDKSRKLKNAFAEADHPAAFAFAKLTRELGVWMVAGSISIKLNANKIANRCLVYNTHGAVVGRYDKIHLFDADPKPGETYRESELVEPGTKAVLVDTPWAKIGLTICYDLRFASLYRKLAKGGAGIITVPSAFTVPTGEAHWHTLLRARAIETGCFILAAAQCGTHDAGRRTYGHSLIIAPWGDIIMEAGEKPEIIMARLDLDKVTAARKAVGSLNHDRDYTGP